MGGYSETITQLKSILIVEMALFNSGVGKGNKSLLLSYVTVIEDLVDRELKEN